MSNVIEYLEDSWVYICMCIVTWPLLQTRFPGLLRGIQTCSFQLFTVQGTATNAFGFVMLLDFISQAVLWPYTGAYLIKLIGAKLWMKYEDYLKAHVCLFLAKCLSKLT